MVSSETTWHVSCVQKRVSKFVNFKVQKVQKQELFDLTDNGFCSSDARGLICHIPCLCAKTVFVKIANCKLLKQIFDFRHSQDQVVLCSAQPQLSRVGRLTARHHRQPRHWRLARHAWLPTPHSKHGETWKKRRSLTKGLTKILLSMPTLKLTQKMYLHKKRTIVKFHSPWGIIQLCRASNAPPKLRYRPLYWKSLNLNYGLL